MLAVVVVVILAQAEQMEPVVLAAVARLERAAHGKMELSAQ
jgi:hypothetical protein